MESAASGQGSQGKLIIPLSFPSPVAAGLDLFRATAMRRNRANLSRKLNFPAPAAQGRAAPALQLFRLSR